MLAFNKGNKLFTFVLIESSQKVNNNAIGNIRSMLSKHTDLPLADLVISSIIALACVNMLY